MSLAPGTHIATFEIVRALGAGGMGEVYEARDPRLNRRVAIKVLPASLATDADRLMRFEREAQAVAALSHPNILAIHDFGRDETRVYAVMELLEGETLRQRLETGAIPVRKAIEYGIQIAQGLAAAHDRGIVHRDLKPENIFITTEDRVKILDFGLAKALETSDVGATLANTAATGAGTVLGTVGYMAPEQVRAQNTDHRVDIFAFGAVLYEMLTSRRAFDGGSAADTISAILNAEPRDIESITPGISPGLDRMVRRCLEKKPELRFQSARDLAFALDALTHGSRVTMGPVETGHARAGALAARETFRLTLAFAALAVIAIALAAWGWLRPAPEQVAWGAFQQVTDASGEERAPSLSPDGTMVAYEKRVGNRSDIYVQRVGGRTATPVAVDPQRNEGSPAFSPDGSLIAFHENDADGGIFIAGATGEAARRLTDIGFHPAWSPDGRRIAFTGESIDEVAFRIGESGLWIVQTGGGAPQRVPGTGDAAQPAWSPDGQRIAFWSNTGGQRDIYTVPASGGQRVAVTDDAAMDWGPAWTPDGRGLIFASNRDGAMNLWQVPIDAGGRPTGQPQPLTNGVQAGSEQPSISRDGTRMAFRSRVAATNPVAVPFNPDTLTAGTARILNGANTFLSPTDISRDGTSILYFSQGAAQEDLFISAIDGSSLRRITDDAARDRGGRFTPDGQSIDFYSSRDGRWAWWRVGRDGGNIRKLVGVADDDLTDNVLSPAGDRMAGSSARGSYIADVSVTPAAGRPLPNTATPDYFVGATDWSPDGRSLAMVMVTRGGRGIGVGVYDVAGETFRQLSTDDTYYARWFADGRRLTYITRNEEWVVLEVATGRRQVVKAALPLPATGDLFALSPDNRLIVYPGARIEADIWVAQRPDAAR